MSAREVAGTDKVGRAPTLTVPEVIDGTPESVAKAICTSKPKKRNEWRSMQRKDAGLVQANQAAADREGIV